MVVVFLRVLGKGMPVDQLRVYGEWGRSCPSVFCLLLIGLGACVESWNFQTSSVLGSNLQNSSMDWLDDLNVLIVSNLPRHLYLIPP
jgi:hypothetical protein